MNRRDFLKSTGAGTALTAWPRPVEAQRAAGALTVATAPGDREVWLDVLTKVAEPVLTHLAAGTLRTRMPVEQAAGSTRQTVTHLEAIGRLLAGMAPWLALPADDSAEGRQRARYVDLARRAVASAVDPASPDFMNFTRERQPLVDAAFLAQGILRAPGVLGDGLDAAVRRHLVAALESTRVIVPGYNNWLLFSATVEAGLKQLGAPWDRVRVDYALRQHDQWYKGDGAYGDGPEFHFDYYNSFVIHPMLVDVLDACGSEMPAWKDLAARVGKRAVRYAAVQERMIGPDGSYPVMGRSLAYRCGAFHLLAQTALRHALPEHVEPAQVRGALTAVIRRTMHAPGTFDDRGWLQIGFAGHQPGVGETYISTGSLYLCATGLLPLGLAASDAFWSAPPTPWTSARAWSGQPFPIDHALTS